MIIKYSAPCQNATQERRAQEQNLGEVLVPGRRYLPVDDNIFLLPYSVNSVTSLIFQRRIPGGRRGKLKGTDIPGEGGPNRIGKPSHGLFLYGS